MYGQLAQKIIVTHISPDFDGIGAIWLLKKFHPDFADARVELVAAGSNTYNNQPVDSDGDVVHVDVGGGRFDHHNTNDFTCAAKLVYQWLIGEGCVREDDEALARQVEILTQLDHGWDSYKWPEAESDAWEFSIHNVLSGLKMVRRGKSDYHIAWALDAMDGVYALLKSKVMAEKEIGDGLKFKTRWGKGVAVSTKNDGVMEVGIKTGFAVVVRKDPTAGYVRITGNNKNKVDLTKAYNEIVARDAVGNWFLHASRVLLRNGSTRNPTMKATKMSLDEVVKVLEKA